MTPLKIVAEASVPYLRGVIEQLGEVQYLPSSAFTPDAIKEADWLIVRSITKCNEALLRGSKVRLITSATIGFDHIDTAYCKRAGITWRTAPGCNAEAVAQYFATAVALLQRETSWTPQGKVLGIVGVGHVGSLVARNARALGMEVLQNDPPRAELEGSEGFVSLETIAAEADMITLHVPLERVGKYATYHLVDEPFITALRRQPILMNACRGAVTDTNALLQGVARKKVSRLMIDCWEGEPLISQDLLRATYLATPHIAGFSAQGKANGARRSVEQGIEFFGLKPLDRTLMTPPPLEHSLLSLQGEEDPLTEALLSIFDIRGVDATLRKSEKGFETLRKEYIYPYEPSQYQLLANELGNRVETAKAIGFEVIER